jgi:hypothetical protein
VINDKPRRHGGHGDSTNELKLENASRAMHFAFSLLKSQIPILQCLLRALRASVACKYLAFTIGFIGRGYLCGFPPKKPLKASKWFDSSQGGITGSCAAGAGLRPGGAGPAPGSGRVQCPARDAQRTWGPALGMRARWPGAAEYRRSGAPKQGHPAEYRDYRAPGTRCARPFQRVSPPRPLPCFRSRSWTPNVRFPQPCWALVCS